MGYSTGNAISDDIGKMNFTGNVIPAIWFQTIKNSSGRPNLLACQLLSEFVYWYRPAEVRDEKTGQFVGYRTKFRGDLLQKSYKSLAELYNVSKQQVVRAVIFLEKEIRVVKRVFRSVPGRDGTVYNNVLYIWLDSERLKELTYPVEDEPDLPSGIDYDEDPVLSYETAADVDNVDKDTPLPSNLMRHIQRILQRLLTAIISQSVMMDLARAGTDRTEQGSSRRIVKTMMILSEDRSVMNSSGRILKVCRIHRRLMYWIPVYQLRLLYTDIRGSICRSQGNACRWGLQ